MARSKVPKGWENTHRILGGAMRLADEAMWLADVHLGGPMPVLDSRSQLLVGIRLLDVVEPSAQARAEFGKLVKLAERCAKDVVIARMELDKATTKAKADEPAVVYAKAVARAGMHYLHSPPSARNTIGDVIESGVAGLVKIVPDVRALLARVDEELCLRELVQMLEERELAAEVVRVIGRAGVGGKIAAIAAELKGKGSYGLLVKLKRKWEWHVGDRATVFATVPDECMEQLAGAFA